MGWRCWEVGAGRGSVARWLARTVGPQGQVLATDLEGRWFDADSANVAFMRHDASCDPPPDDNFDLIHARLLLEHLADPRPVIARLAGALRPGGVLVAEDAAGLQITVMPPTPLFEQLASPWERAGQAVGWQAPYGTALINDLLAAGLTGVRGQQHRLIAPGGPDWRHVRAGLERLRAELAGQGVAEQDLDAALRYLDDPGNLITGPPIIVAWGHRATSARSEPAAASSWAL